MLQHFQEEPKSPEMKEMLDEVGFTYFLILARMHDIDPKMAKNGQFESIWGKWEKYKDLV